MTTQVTATVVGGLLKPDRKLELADESRVCLTIEPLAERPEPAGAADRVALLLAALDKARNVQSIGGLKREELYDRNVLH